MHAPFQIALECTILTGHGNKILDPPLIVLVHNQMSCLQKGQSHTQTKIIQKNTNLITLTQPSYSFRNIWFKLFLE